MKNTKVGLGILGLGMVFAFATFALAAHDPFLGEPQDKVVVCHWNNGHGGRYEDIEVAIDSSGAPQGGHDSHKNDIIPPYHWTDGEDDVSYPGHNWNGNTESIWNNGGCDGDGTLPEPEVSDVTICKYDETETPLSGWEVMLIADDESVLDGTTGENGCVTLEDVGFGDYTLDETLQEGWENVSGKGDSVIVDEETETFNLVNEETDDVPPPSSGGVIVEKVIINDEGGTASTTDFSFFVGGTPVTLGAETSFATGTYQVTETGPGGYTANFGGSCDVDGNITVSPSATTTCVITNNDNGASTPPTEEEEDDDSNSGGGGGGSSSRRRSSSNDDDGDPEILGASITPEVLQAQVTLPLGAPATGHGGLKMCLL